MDWFWNRGGECFGHQDNLFAYFCREVDRFGGEEIYRSNGRYLGEVMSENRLITSRSKKGWVRDLYARYANSPSYAMYAGYEDFPAPDSFR